MYNLYIFLDSEIITSFLCFNKKKLSQIKKQKNFMYLAIILFFYVQFNIDYSGQDILLMNIETIRPSVYSARAR